MVQQLPLHNHPCHIYIGCDGDRCCWLRLPVLLLPQSPLLLLLQVPLLLLLPLPPLLLPKTIAVATIPAACCCCCLRMCSDAGTSTSPCMTTLTSGSRVTVTLTSPA